MAQAVRPPMSHFKQIFKERTGHSPMSYLQRVRLEKAHQILSDTHSFLQIKEIAFKCGFVSDSHFAREFKKRHAVTPTDFRAARSKSEQSD
jgi:AraC family transcriptional regulator